MALPLDQQNNGFSLRKLKRDVEVELNTRILPFHLNHVCDPSNGGFYGSIANDLTIDFTAPKGLTQCARLLWTYARAYRIFKLPQYIEMALYAYMELDGRFHDPINGGFYWSLTPEGRPFNMNKLVYGQAFAIYGLSELFLATGNKQVLNQAIALFQLLEKHAVDTVYGGYWESCSVDWQKNKDSVDEVSYSVAKSMNTHLHLLESYTNLLLAWNNTHLRQRLYALIDIHQQHIFNPATGHLDLHFDTEWQSINNHISYGHDIEASWLLWEAAEILDNPEICTAIRPSVLRLAEVTLEEGIDKDGGLFNEADPSGSSNYEKHWWPQAEALVGFLNAFQMTGEQRFLDVIFGIWEFIQGHIVDIENGGWFWGIDSKGVPLSKEKAGMWKTPYHNGRASFELISRIDTILSQVY